MFNFHNIGGKIKGLAKFNFAFAAIVQLIGSVCLIVLGIIAQSWGMILLGVVCLILDPIIAWISSWLLYGFGQLIENTDILAGRLDLRAVEPQGDDSMDDAEDMVVYCPHCDAEIPVPQEAPTERLEMHCPQCGKPFFVQ